MPHKVRYDGAARADLQSIADWIAAEAGATVALNYIGRIEAACEGLAHFPRRGRLRRRVSAIRSIAFRRNATILYRISRRDVLILRVLHAGRDVAHALAGVR